MFAGGWSDRAILALVAGLVGNCTPLHTHTIAEDLHRQSKKRKWTYPINTSMFSYPIRANEYFQIKVSQYLDSTLTIIKQNDKLCDTNSCTML